MPVNISNPFISLHIIDWRSLVSFLFPRFGCIVVLLGIGSNSGAEPAAKWLEPADEYVTPHINWAKPNVQGAMRGLYITYRLGMREVVDISEGFEFEREVFAIELTHRFSGGMEAGQIKPLVQSPLPHLCR